MNIHTWVQTSPQLKLLYMMAAFALGALTLWGMGQLHDCQSAPGTRHTPVNVMRAFRISLFVCALTIALQFAMPSEQAERLPDGILALIHLRNLGGFAGFVYFVLGVVELARPSRIRVGSGRERTEDEEKIVADLTGYPPSDRSNQPMHRRPS